jgi:hypothetical protein
VWAPLTKYVYILVLSLSMFLPLHLRTTSLMIASSSLLPSPALLFRLSSDYMSNSGVRSPCGFPRVTRSPRKRARCCLLSAVCCLRSSICYLLSALCSLLSAVCCLPSAICRLLSTVLCLLASNHRQQLYPPLLETHRSCRLQFAVSCRQGGHWTRSQHSTALTVMLSGRPVVLMCCAMLFCVVFCCSKLSAWGPLDEVTAQHSQ